MTTSAPKRSLCESLDAERLADIVDAAEELAEVIAVGKQVSSSIG